MNQEYVIADADKTEKFWSRGSGWTSLDKAAKFGGYGDALQEIVAFGLEADVVPLHDEEADR